MPDDRGTGSFFEDVVTAHTGSEFVRRQWLESEIESALGARYCRYVLLTAEPGAGKTCLVAAMAAGDPHRPRYFARRNSATPLTGGGARSFLLSVGHQLARRRPHLFRPDGLDIAVRQQVDSILPGGRAVGVRVEDLTVSPFFPTAFAVDQTVGEVEGELVGAEIGRLTVDPHTLTTADLTHMALLEPAAALAAGDPDARIVVLFDALDEVVDDGPDNMLDWLAAGPELPANVRLVITSRPHVHLELFRRRRRGQFTEFGIDPRSPDVRRDLVTYAGRVLGAGTTARAVEAHGTTTEEVAEAVARRAEGNFAYLVAYGRALTEAMKRVDDELRDRLLSFSDVPTGLDSLYGLFMASIHRDIASMGMIEVIDPLPGGDTHCPAWEGVGQPILGVLVVAREPLTVDQLARLSRVRVWGRHVASVVDRLAQFLDRTPTGFRLFHSSIAEFLLGDQVRRDHSGWAFDEREWHESIVLSCRGTAPSWDQVDWSQVDPYGTRHVAAHLARCRDRLADDLPDLVTPALRREQRLITGTDSEFLTVVDLATERATSRFPPGRALPAVLFLGVAARYTKAGTAAPPALVGLLARVGRIDEALHHVRSQPPSARQVEGLRAVLRHASAMTDDERRRELAIELARYSRAVPPDRGSMGVSFDDRRRAVEAAAVELAPYNLAEAQRLAELARTLRVDRDTDDGDRGLVDSIHRAAARSAPVERVIELVARMHTGRAGACLDAAEHGRDPAERTRLLAVAEESLATEEPGLGLVCRARLAVAWSPVDGQRSRRWAESVETGIASGPVPAGDGDADGRPSACVDALRRLATVDPDRARALLETCAVGVRPLEAARLWAEWGNARRCRELTDPALLGDRNLTEAAGIVALVDPDEARRLLDRALDRIEPARDTDPLSGRWRAEALAAVAPVLATLDADRALAVAQEISGREFGQDGTERATALAEMAHARLDAGQSSQEEQLLAACLAEIDTPPKLAATEVPTAVPFRVATGARNDPVGLRDSLFLSQWTTNLHQDWLWRSRRRLVTDPAAVVRAVLPGPHTVGTPHCWERTLRHWAEAVAAHRTELAERVLAHVDDAGERAVGLAGIGASAWRGGDLDTARRWWAAATAALRATPRFEWKADTVAATDFFNRHKQTLYAAPGFTPGPLDLDTEDVRAYLLPDRRAAFEVALRRGPIGDPEFDGLDSDSPFLRRAYRAAVACATSHYQVDRTVLGAPWPAEEIAFHREQVDAQVGNDPLARTTRTRLVAAGRVLRDRGSRTPDGRRRDVPTPPSLTVPDPVDAGLVHVLGVRAGLPVADRVVEAVHDLLMLATDRLPEVAHLAALGAAAVAALDADAASNLTTTVTAVLHQSDDPFTRALGLARLAEPSELARFVPSTVVDEAADALDTTLGSVRRDQLLATVFPVLVSRCSARAASLLATALRTDWTEAMALLEWATPALVDTHGVDVVEQLVVAFERGQRFHSPARPLAGPRRVRGATPDGITGRRR